jgi:hypothetical protein
MEELGVSWHFDILQVFSGGQVFSFFPAGDNSLYENPFHQNARRWQ